MGPPVLHACRHDVRDETLVTTHELYDDEGRSDVDYASHAWKAVPGVVSTAGSVSTITKPTFAKMSTIIRCVSRPAHGSLLSSDRSACVRARQPVLIAYS